MLTESFLAILVIVACVAGLGLGGVTASLSGPAIGALQTDANGVSRPVLLGAPVTVPFAGGQQRTIGVLAEARINPRGELEVAEHAKIHTLAIASSPGSFIGALGLQTGSQPQWDAYRENPDPLIASVTGEAVYDPLRFDGSVVHLQSNGELRLYGDLAFAQQYRSWNAAGGLAATVGAFVTGAANLVEALGIPEGMAVALMGVLVASFAGTTMDTACRLNRYVLQELARTFLPKRGAFACAACGYDLKGVIDGKQVEVEVAAAAMVRCPECGAERPQHEIYHHDAGDRAWHAASNLNPFKWLATVHGATMFAVVAAAILAAIPPTGATWTLANAGKGGMILWPLFGATNQLLGGLAFIVIYAWLRATRRPTWIVVPAAIFMLIVPAWAMIWQAFIGNEGTASWWETKQWPLLAFALVVLTLEAWLLIETARRLPRLQRAIVDARTT
ncbi:MAG: hypothetical protein IBJ10_01360 [Phycisphaerales bacterium]|nr:hypothetical protein [Phycisphaerales bacterium]